MSLQDTSKVVYNNTHAPLNYPFAQYCYENNKHMV